MKTYVRYAITIALAAVLLPGITAQAGPDIIKQQQQSKPLSFIENKGQITDQHGRRRTDIDYKLETPGMNIYVGDGQLHYQWMQADGDKQVNTYRMDVVLTGANKQAQVMATEQQGYYEQFYLPQCSEGAIAHAYTRITYKDIYPHIDWVIYSRNNELKYDFVVRPGGDPKQIKLRYEGATALALQQDGALTATTPMGHITEQEPYSYIAGTNKMVASRYILQGHTLQYKLADYNGTLVIDPTLDWATYYGGGGEGLGATAMDVPGNIYLTGVTISTSNIATTGAFQATLAGNNDAYLSKFNSAGVRQWATYYGGSGTESLPGVSCDNTGNVYLAGRTNSTSGIASTGAHQTSNAGSTDCFLAKFNASGTRQWATYYGGSSSDELDGITCDPTGNVYIAGSSASTTGIATTGSHQASHAGGNWDAFIAKFNSSGIRQWGTYYGSTSGDYFHDIACDPSGNVYAVGETATGIGLATVGAFQSTAPVGVGHHKGLVVKLNSSGVRQWATYYFDFVWIYGITCTATDLYITGTTGTTDPSFASPGTHQTSYAGGHRDGFLARFDLAGNHYWGTYYGGTEHDYIKSVATDASGNVYVSGTTSSISNMATTTGYQPSHGGGTWDVVLAQFSPSGNRLWATYHGGTGLDENGSTGDDQRASFLVSNGAFIAMAGNTRSTNGIATTGAYQTTLSGNGNNFLVRLKADTILYIPQPYTDTLFCPGASFSLAYTVTGNFRSGNTFTAQLSDASGDFSSPTNIGTVTSSTSGTISCTIPANAAAGSGYRVRVVSTAPARTSANNGIDIRVKPVPVPTAASNSPVCEGGTVNLTATAPAGSTYSWIGPNSFGPVTTQNPSISSVTSAGAGNYIVTATLNGCSGKDTVTVSITSLPATPLPFNNGPLCPGDMLSFGVSNAIAGGAYNWSGPVSFTGTATPSVSSVAATHAGTYSVTVVANGCTSQPGTTTVVVKPLPATPVFTGSSSVCLGGTLTLDAASDPGSTYEWGGPNGFSSTLKNPSIAAVTKAAQGNYTVRATLNGCKSTTANSYVTVNIVANIGGYASPNDTICKGDTVTFVGFPQNGGPAPVFEWYKNGAVVTNNKIFNTSDVKTGDKFWCTMTAPNICGPIPVVISTDTIRMVVEGIQVTPVVKISASPAVTGDPAQNILFTATPQWGGTSPKYMWYKNGVATGNKLSTWSTSGIRIGDVISVEMESQHPCAAVMGAADTVAIQFPTSIKEQNNHSISLYPNPNKGSFTVEGITAAQVQLSIINVLGQVVHTATQQQVNGSMGIDAKLPIGAYLVRMQADGQSYTLRFNVAE